MCGIAGIAWSEAGRVSPPGLIESMTTRLERRGPDGSGHFERPGVSLGHRRLSIIDLEGGKQPLSNEDGSIWVTFNGEIYNFQELQKDLEARGHQFRTHCDTEVLVHLYEDHGTDMLRFLRGMFAFAIWDGRKKSLFFARDRLGVKPLVYWHDGEGLRFASELKALTVEPSFPKEVDERAIDDFLTLQYIPAPLTIYKNVSKLPPAHFGLYEQGRLTLQRYWKADYTEAVHRTEEDYIEELRHTLTEATRLRMIADVPLGAFLSGGIDSTIVVGLMRKVSNAPVKTFSIGFPVKEFDERVYARMAAEHLGTEHEEFVVEPDAVDVVEKLAWYYDEPFADSSAVPTYYVSKLTRQRVTVALTGDAGDELFAGYHRYQAMRIGERFDKMPGLARALMTARYWQWLPSSGRQKSKARRLKKLLRVLGEAPADRFRHWVSIFDETLRPTMYSEEFKQTLGGHRSSQIIDSLFAELSMRDSVTRATYVDLNSYLPGALLPKVDIASMANSLECRGPFLDQEVVAIAGKMPIELKLRGNVKKYILKKAFAEFLPDKLVHRPKMGFGVPIDHWFRAELAPMVQDLLLDSSGLLSRGWFARPAVEKLVSEHMSNRWDHSARLWALMMLELWAKNFLDSNDVPTEALSGVGTL